MGIKDTYTVKSIKPKETHDWLLNKHYAKRIPSISWAFGLFDDYLQGVCTFGGSANKSMNEIIDGIKTLELNRLITNDDLPKNSESYFISQCLKMLPRPSIIYSYSDPNIGHNGYVYQATNWIYTGKGVRANGNKDTGVTQFEKDGKNYHAKSVYEKIGTCAKEEAEKYGYKRLFLKPKHRYFYLVGSKREKRIMKQKLPFREMEYPKGENENYDASYIPQTQTTLF